MTRELPGREELARWVDARPRNFYDASAHLRDVLDVHAGVERREGMEQRLHDFGAKVATIIEPAVASCETHREFPALVAYDGIGRRVDRIEFHPDHERASRAVWGSGLMACDTSLGGAFEQAALFYLLSHVGEGGLACPAVCTVGLSRAIANRGPGALSRRYLAGLRARGLDGSLLGSQFLTEVQGGSDVGANIVVATPDAELPGAWRISGEKWFCSVANADLFAVTARYDAAVDGTRGLGCFLVARTLDNHAPNGFRIRQLKDKLGTRGLASGEIDFDGALAWPIGAVGDGFHIAVEELLNTSRWLNAIGSTGLMRRAYLEAASFARHRHAFNRSIGSIPIVREQLAMMKTEEYAALSSTMALTGMIDRLDQGLASERDRAVHRFLVNVNKFRTSYVATEVVHQGIEILGGNGTIEPFSPLPRLYRDAVVYESWEGTHNVLCAQVQRDCARMELLDEVVAWTNDELHSSSVLDVAVVQTELSSCSVQLRNAITNGDAGAGQVRRLLDRFAQIVQASLLASASTRADSVVTGVAQMFVRRHFGDPWAPAQDAEVDRALGADLEDADVS